MVAPSLKIPKNPKCLKTRPRLPLHPKTRPGGPLWSPVPRLAPKSRFPVPCAYIKQPVYISTFFSRKKSTEKLGNIAIIKDFETLAFLERQNVKIMQKNDDLETRTMSNLSFD